MESSLKNTELVWVDHPLKLREVAIELADEEIIAVDTESNSLYAYQEEVCLIQFSTMQKDYLIDSMVLSDLSSLSSIFSSKKILKVFHAAEYDLICLFRDYGFRFNYLFDTMIAARVLGYQAVGLGSLLEQHFGFQMDKRYQRANWGKRPLPKEMLEYARLDSHYLIPLQAILREELENSGRWEIGLEDFRRLTQGVEDTTESTEEDFWKLRGARDLSPERAAVLKSVYQMRESKAKSQNKPPFKIFSNQVIIEVAQNCPKDLPTLSEVTCLSDRLVKQYGREILKAVQAGKNSPPEYPPKCDRPENSVLDRIEWLRIWRRDRGKALGVPSDVVLPRDVLTRVAWTNPSNLETLASQMKDVPHRFEQYGEEIFEIIKKGNNHL